MINKYYINNWYMDGCIHQSEEDSNIFEEFFLIKGDYTNHPFLKSNDYVPYFQLFEIENKEGIDHNNNIYKLNNFIPTSEFQSEFDALNYINNNLLS